MTTLSAVDWPAWSFVFATTVAAMYFWRESANPKSTFRLIQFVSNPDGTGNSASLAYTLSLLVSTWLLWYETINQRGSVELVLAYTGVFVTGGVLRSGISAYKDSAADTQTTTLDTTTTTTQTRGPA